MSCLNAAVTVFFALWGSCLQAGPSVTVYNSDLAVVREERQFDLKDGEQTVRYAGVAAKLDPTSVHLEGQGVRLLEQDYDFDLVSADRVLEKYVGQAIKASGKGGPSYNGELLAYEDGQLVLKEADGRVRMLNRSELVSLEFPGLPGGLLTRPTLVWKLRSDGESRRPLTLTYSTGGISWHAEYVAVLSGDEHELGLNGWVSVDNQSGASYEDARLKLMAGDVHRVQPPRPRAMFAASAMGDLAPPPAAAFEERAFSDYHLYTLAWPVTLRQAQVKQVELFSAAKIPAKKIYTFDAERLGAKVGMVLQLVNRKTDGLGMPLPAGKWRVFKDDGRGNEFIGEDALGHTPVDEDIRLDLGSAFDVAGDRTVLKESADSKGRVTQRRVKLELRNRKSDRVDVVLREHIPGGWSVLKSDADFKPKDSDTVEATVSLKPGEVRDWEYTAGGPSGE